jgi:hypothetical protein
MTAGNIHYQFDAGAGVPVVVKVTSETQDADGNYPAVTTVWNTTDEVWDDSETVVKLKAANDETLVSGNRYLAVPAGLNADDERVYVMDGGAGGTPGLGGHQRLPGVRRRDGHLRRLPARRGRRRG